MEKIKFSVCIPNYNYAHLIVRTIESVLYQTYPVYEIIIADNNSTDNSLDVINSIKDDRIKIIKNQVNVGFGANLDIVTEQASGDFIILLSSDDIMLKKALEIYAKIIVEFDNQSELVLFSAYDIIDGEGNIISTKEAIPSNIKNALLNEKVHFEEGDLYKAVDGQQIMKALLTTTLGSAGAFCSTCYSRSLYNQVGGYRSPTLIIPDATFVHKLGFKNAKFVYSEEKLFQYRIHGSSNYAATLGMKNIKLLTDMYSVTHLYSNADLEILGLNRASVIQSFIKLYCIDVPFYAVLKTDYPKAYFHWIFGLASYPKIAMRFWRFYFILLALPILGLYAALAKPFKTKNKLNYPN